MKPEWRNIPDLGDIAGAWIAGLSIPAVLVVCLTIRNLPNTATTTNRHAISTAGWWALGIWFGPIILGFIIYMALCAWAVRPRRVWVPLTEDAREAESKNGK